MTKPDAEIAAVWCIGGNAEVVISHTQETNFDWEFRFADREIAVKCVEEIKRVYGPGSNVHYHTYADDDEYFLVH